MRGRGWAAASESGALQICTEVERGVSSAKVWVAEVLGAAIPELVRQHTMYLTAAAAAPPDRGQAAGEGTDTVAAGAAAEGVVPSARLTVFGVSSGHADDPIAAKLQLLYPPASDGSDGMGRFVGAPSGSAPAPAHPIYERVYGNLTFTAS